MVRQLGSEFEGDADRPVEVDPVHPKRVNGVAGTLVGRKAADLAEGAADQAEKGYGRYGVLQVG